MATNVYTCGAGFFVGTGVGEGVGVGEELADGDGAAEADAEAEGESVGSGRVGIGLGELLAVAGGSIVVRLATRAAEGPADVRAAQPPGRLADAAVAASNRTSTTAKSRRR